MVNAAGPDGPAETVRRTADERAKKRGEIVFDVAEIAGEPGGLFISRVQ